MVISDHRPMVTETFSIRLYHRSLATGHYINGNSYQRLSFRLVFLRKISINRAEGSYS